MELTFTHAHWQCQVFPSGAGGERYRITGALQCCSFSRILKSISGVMVDFMKSKKSPADFFLKKT